MNAPDQTLNFGRLAKRFVLPAISAWLLHTGMWLMIIFVVTTPVISALSKSINWFLDAFYGGNRTIVETYWVIKYTVIEAVEGAILVVSGVLVGAWVLRRQKKAHKKALA